ncbi:MAG: hypothetical protein M0P74_02465 [Syntrophales bacterium]|jgi:hypothetical protein|nr:hypothetical protein [Syntrophales bacterium]
MQNSNYIHYDPERVDYSLTPSELENLQTACQSNWKDFFIGSFAVGIPCLINAISEISKQTSYQTTLSINLNLISGILGIIMGVFFLIGWNKTKTDISEIIGTIKEKPKIPFIPGVSNVGPMKPADTVNCVENITYPNSCG